MCSLAVVIGSLLLLISLYNCEVQQEASQYFSFCQSGSRNAHEVFAVLQCLGLERGQTIPEFC